MIKKISISTLLLLFFVSTTGLPLSIHFCKMGSSAASQTCTIHNEMNKKMHQSCNQDKEENSYFTVEKGSCCKTEIVNKPISDKFLQVDAQKHNLKQNITPVIISDLAIGNNSPAITFNYFTDSSPPTLINNHIYLNNSVLLI